ncbi:hypothetical protein P691DRAFT_785013 [Macrolepiota fuliginosa MF-IS2]|uniref:Uncharacterized protein n=1 Tax=Macrolepiota fuliginosa MF-IS2 TaxID=1400762 RepID=A0A9P5WWT0_9AGAR|nr:hypothetical protein P691DRAFT_785013 [Macrolepiota fuliginosa MF-IS2]
MSYGVECMIERAAGEHNQKLDQIPVNTFLGRMFKGGHKGRKAPEEEHYKSSDGEFDNKSNSINSFSDDSQWEEPQGYQRHEHGQQSRPQYKDLACRKPNKYNGETSILKFHQYMSQYKRYLEEGNASISGSKNNWKSLHNLTNEYKSWVQKLQSGLKLLMLLDVMRLDLKWTSVLMRMGITISEVVDILEGAISLVKNPVKMKEKAGNMSPKTKTTGNRIQKIP